jgi:hypothetical protein
MSVRPSFHLLECLWLHSFHQCHCPSVCQSFSVTPIVLSYHFFSSSQCISLSLSSCSVPLSHFLIFMLSTSAFSYLYGFCCYFFKLYNKSICLWILLFTAIGLLLQQSVAIFVLDFPVYFLFPLFIFAQIILLFDFLSSHRQVSVLYVEMVRSCKIYHAFQKKYSYRFVNIFLIQNIPFSVSNHKIYVYLTIRHNKLFHTRGFGDYFRLGKWAIILPVTRAVKMENYGYHRMKISPVTWKDTL